MEKGNDDNKENHKSIGQQLVDIRKELNIKEEQFQTFKTFKKSTENKLNEYKILLEEYNKKERFVCANVEKITKDIPEEHRLNVQKLILKIVNIHIIVITIIMGMV